MRYSKSVELRKHPKMKWKGRSNWPPAWIGPHGSDQPLPKGEVGTLLRVECASQNVNFPCCYLYIQWKGQDYVGSLYFDDPSLMEKLCEILKRYIEHEVSDIGNLEIKI